MSKQPRRNRTVEELEKLKADVRSKSTGKAVVFLENLPEKMSEVIEDFIEPYRPAVTTSVEYQNLIAVAVIAWNAALLPKSKRAALLRDLHKVVTPPGDRRALAALQALVGEMIKRKEQYFANNRRYIINYRVTEMPAGMYISIAASIE